MVRTYRGFHVQSIPVPSSPPPFYFAASPFFTPTTTAASSTATTTTRAANFYRGKPNLTIAVVVSRPPRYFPAKRSETVEGEGEGEGVEKTQRGGGGGGGGEGARASGRNLNERSGSDRDLIIELLAPVAAGIINVDWVLPALPSPLLALLVNSRRDITEQIRRGRLSFSLSLSLSKKRERFRNRPGNGRSTEKKTKKEKEERTLFSKDLLRVNVSRIRVNKYALHG